MKQQLLFLMLTLFLGFNTAYSQKHLSHSIYEEYDFLSKEFSEAMKQEYPYNSNRLAMITYSYKNNADWVENLRHVFKYNDDGNLIEESYATKVLASSEWVNRSKNVTNYNDNKVESSESFEWKNGEWKPDEKTVLNYVGNRIESFDGFEWEDMQWKADSRSVIKYEGNKIETITTEEFKNGVWTFHDKDT